MVKFFGGPLTGAALGLNFWQTFGLTVGGMMTSVTIFSLLGSAATRYYAKRRREKNKPMFNKKSRRIVKVWQKFGMGGIAFLTPLILSPIIGTIIATVLGAKRGQILLHMLWSAVLWGTIFTFALINLRHWDIPFIGK
ncbi:hypothetical protein I5M27_10510 [Adhaeribacter sp. BT258]|uniref:Small multi-drug export protein n=2 Tax=Adhaeribacter terrigena TaxID=2793070 RepID=A0ABS1C1Z5_9BACT|nr:hypothetical protein [Adhaeribacter terrigena]MBK0403419.1 hypothetical protein [Adhaeribacter terrigena]